MEDFVPGRLMESIRVAACHIWGFPKIRGTLLGVPIRRTIVFWGLYWGPLILGNYHLPSFKIARASSMSLEAQLPIYWVSDLKSLYELYYL